MVLGTDKYKNMCVGFSGPSQKDALIYSGLTYIAQNIKLFLSSVCSNWLVLMWYQP